MTRKKLVSILLICMVVALLVGMISIGSLAGGNDPEVVYNHAKRVFVFRNMDKAEYKDGDSTATGERGNGLREYPDLFRNFKNVMPGDTLTQTFAVSAENLRNEVVEIVLRASYGNDIDSDGSDDISDEEQDAFRMLMDSGAMTLSVSWENESRSYDYKVSQLLTEGVSLGKFFGDQSHEVTVTLTFSPEAGNELADLQAGIGWVFTAHGNVFGGDIPPGGGAGGYLPPWPGGTGDAGGSSVEHVAYIVGKTDGLVHPEAQITRAEVAAIFFRLLTEEVREKYWGDINPYSDVLITDWFNHEVSTLTNAGLIFGKPGNIFDPFANITRAELAALAVRFFGYADVELGNEDSFPDIADHWANYEINLAYAMDLVEGMPDGTFQPDREITRAETMAIVNRALNREPHKDHLLEDMITWPDNMDTEAWYYADVQEATNSHTYLREKNQEGETYEIWQELLEVWDWVALERYWATHYASSTPGEVVSSRDSYRFE